MAHYCIIIKIPRFLVLLLSKQLHIFVVRYNNTQIKIYQNNNIMIVFTLHKKTGRANFPISVESNNVERKMFALLFDYVGIDIAIDASSWCDLACVGDVYEHEMFTIVCEESEIMHL
jgi:hypothetical protein